jgi:hypothetical protein
LKDFGGQVPIALRCFMLEYAPKKSLWSRRLERLH